MTAYIFFKNVAFENNNKKNKNKQSTRLFSFWLAALIIPPGGSETS